DLLGAFEKRFGRRLEQRQLLEFVEQLHQLDLLADASATPASPSASPTPRENVPAPVPLSPADPGRMLNRFFDLLVAGFGWLVHPLWIVPLLGLAAVATTAVVRHWDRCLVSLAKVQVFPT